MQNSSSSGELSRPWTNDFMSATVARGFTSSSKRICRATSRARLRRDMWGGDVGEHGARSRSFLTHCSALACSLLLRDVFQQADHLQRGFGAFGAFVADVAAGAVDGLFHCFTR